MQFPRYFTSCRLTSGLGLSLLFACGAATAPQATSVALPTASAVPPAVQLPATSASAAAAPSATIATPTASAVATAPPVRAEWESPLRFELMMAEGIRAFSLDLDTWVTVLGNSPSVFDGRNWTRLAEPAQLRSSGNEQFDIGIYLGRDNKPRIMGSRWEVAQGRGQANPVYLRYKGNRWQPDPKEIGRLGKKPFTGLFGVLGNADPEVVCKVGDACIIKRRSGWTTLPRVRELGRVWLCASHVFSLDSKGMRRLDQAVWTNVSWEFDGRGKETGFWATSAQNYWVSVAGDNALYRFDGAKWDRFESPVEKPKAIWASAASDVWVVGENGAGHFDGTSWARVKGLTMPLESVSGRNEKEVWLGGPQGLFRGKAR